MVQRARKATNVKHMQGDWMARDVDGWRVNIPCPGGSGFFSFKEYGGSAKAYEAARKFQIKAYNQYKKDLEYKRKHGELPKRETLNIRNRSGYRGVCRNVHPRLDGPPRIEWIAYWQDSRGIQQSESFTTAAHIDEHTCKKLALAKRAEMTNKK